jgi:hypothetical protein
MKQLVLFVTLTFFTLSLFAQECTSGKGVFIPNETYTREIYWKTKLLRSFKGKVSYVNTTDGNRLMAQTDFQGYYKDGEKIRRNTYKEIVTCSGADYQFSVRTVAEISGMSPMFLLEEDNLINIKEGVFSFPIAGKDGDALPDLLLKGMYHLSVGDTKEYPIEFELTNGKYVGKESLTVPAGTFNCIKYSFTIRMNAGTLGRNTSDEITMWVSEGLIVKSEEKTQKGKIIANSQLSVLNK